MNRRTVLTAALSAPAVALAGSLPVVAAAESAVMALFREWVAARAAYNAASDEFLAEDVEARLQGRLSEVERRMREAKTQNVQDLAAKIIVADDHGDFLGTPNANALLIEARALVA